MDQKGGLGCCRAKEATVSRIPKQAGIGWLNPVQAAVFTILDCDLQKLLYCIVLSRNLQAIDTTNQY